MIFADSPFVKAGNENVSDYTSKVNFVSNAAYSLQVVGFFFFWMYLSGLKCSRFSFLTTYVKVGHTLYSICFKDAF